MKTSTVAILETLRLIDYTHSLRSYSMLLPSGRGSLCLPA